MISLVDQLNRPIDLKEPAKRIVSLVPSITEFLNDIGLEQEVIGITKFCIKPEHWLNEKQRVGGTKTLAIDTIISLKPDLILANKEENTQEQIELLAELFPTYISDINKLEDTYLCLTDIGILCNRKFEAEQMNKSIKEGFHQLKNRVKGKGVYYFIWQNPIMIVGSNTFINSILEYFGFNNLGKYKGERYPETSLAEIKNSQADYIFLSSEPYPFKKKQQKEIQLEFPNTNVVLVDGEAFSWYGSRLKHSLPYYNSLLNSLTVDCQ